MSKYYRVTLKSEVQEVAYIRAENMDDCTNKAEFLGEDLTDRDGRHWHWDELKEVNIDDVLKNIRA